MDLSFKKNPNNLPDVLILCGGQGTRLRSVVSDNPKPLATIGNKAFLDILLQTIFDQEFNRVILAVGYMKDKIIARYSGDPRVLFSIEESPLGTGGAVVNALDLVRTEHFIVMNGDSYCGMDLKKMYNEYLKRNPFISLAVFMSDDISDSGSVLIDENGQIHAFREKAPEKQNGLVSVGIYVFSKKIKDYRPERDNFSLEHDLFPLVINREFCYGHIIEEGFLDIGTPERYNLMKQRWGL